MTLKGWRVVKPQHNQSIMQIVSLGDNLHEMSDFIFKFDISWHVKLYFVAKIK